jgi:hypothetical protein
MSPVAFAMLALAAAPPTPTPFPVNPPVCEDRLVAYAPLGEHARARISIERRSGPPRLPAGPESRQQSPQGTRWLVAVEPDFTRPGPWVTTLAIGGNPTGGEMLRVTFSDHGSGGVRPTWLNEKLLFIQVWWGRIASSDLVLDVERAALLVAEDADLAALLGPCEPRTATP